MPGSTRKYEMAALAGILLLAAFFRFWQLPETPPGLYPDEAANGNNALEALRTGEFKIFYPENNGREGLFINLQAAAIGLFGAEPWALRVVSAIFGTLTILGLYLLTKELLTEHKPQATNHKPQTNAKDQSAKRFGIWNLEFGIYRGELIALLSSFFFATSFWHINFSRIGFRAILVPFFTTFGTYWLLKAMRTEKISNTLAAGIAIGLGFHTYIAFRFMPLVLAVPITAALWQWYKRDADMRMHANSANKQHSRHSRGAFASFASPCTPCVIALFLFVTLVAALPIGLHFLQNPSDFFGRGGQVSILSAESPLREFGKSTALTLGMFNVRGDCNSRHNLDCQPQLFWPVGILFIMGLAITIREAFRREPKPQIPNTKLQTSSKHQAPNYKRFGIWDLGLGISHSTSWLLLAWFFFMMLPATLTREGLPHALRAIGMIPPAMILAGIGGVWLWHHLTVRISGFQFRVSVALTVLFLIWIPLHTYRGYFIRFAHAPATRDAFAADLWGQGQYLARLPDDVQKFVIVNLSGENIRGVPAPAQTIMFATDTFDEARRRERNIRYVTRVEDIAIDETRRVAIMPMNPRGQALMATIKRRFPWLSVKVVGDGVVFQN